MTAARVTGVTDTTDAVRQRTAVDEIADAHLDAEIALDPEAATSLGVPGHETELTDYSPEGHAARREVGLRTLRALDGVEPADDVDRVTIAALRERLGLAEDLYALGAADHDLNVLASPMQSMRSVYDLMSKDSAADWATIVTRLTRTPQAMQQYVASLRTGKARGVTPARRQVEKCAAQAEQHALAKGFFAELASGARAGGRGAADVGFLRPHGRRRRCGTGLRRLRDVPARGAAAAGRRYGRDRARALPAALALVPRARNLDLEETYAWGQEAARRGSPPGGEADLQTASSPARRSPLGHGVPGQRPGPQAARHRCVAGLDAAAESDAAVAALADTHSDIPEPILTLECKIAPTQSGGIYYTGPSQHPYRPVRDAWWWPVPEGVTEFSLPGAS